MMEVADQKPIFLAREEVVDVMKKEDKQKPRQFCQGLKLFCCFALLRRAGNDVSGFNPNLPMSGTYSPAGYKFFPERLTGTVGMDLPETMASGACGSKIKRSFIPGKCRPIFLFDKHGEITFPRPFKSQMPNKKIPASYETGKLLSVIY